MIAKHYTKVFVFKIAISIIAVALIFFGYIKQDTKNNASTIIFVVDMQNSMGTKDIKDDWEQAHTRQQTAMAYIDYVVQHIETGTKVGIIRVWYYPDYIVPPTSDLSFVAHTIQSLISSPLSPDIYYETGDISLQIYYNYLPNATYIVISDKSTTVSQVKKYISQSIAIGIAIASWWDKGDISINQREDIQEQPQPAMTVQSPYLWWIFICITILWLAVL